MFREMVPVDPLSCCCIKSFKALLRMRCRSMQNAARMELPLQQQTNQGNIQSPLEANATAAQGHRGTLLWEGSIVGPNFFFQFLPILKDSL